MLFSEMNLPPEILRAVEEVGYAEATDIQYTDSNSVPPAPDMPADGMSRTKISDSSSDNQPTDCVPEK